MSDFRAAMAAASVSAFWEQEVRTNSPPVSAHIWRWQTMDPLIDGAVAATNMHNAERRVLTLTNPAFAGTARRGATTNLTVNLQVLMPGERARPHRHTMHALRFVLESDGATTIVEGKDCPMLPGDMILTPGWTWHEHAHAGKTRAVWVDALDVPINEHLETSIFEPGPTHDMVALPSDQAFASAGLAPDLPGLSTAYSPMFRYPWDEAVRTLEAMPAGADGSRRLRYTNPVTGGAVMSTIDCYLQGLTQGVETVPTRTNANAACVVMEGEGVSRFGEETLRWGPKDIFTLPHGQWISHKATTRSARLFYITDREVLRRLELLRDEIRH